MNGENCKYFVKGVSKSDKDYYQKKLSKVFGHIKVVYSTMLSHAIGRELSSEEEQMVKDTDVLGDPIDY